MRKIILLLFMLFAIQAFSQTNIGGIINKYAAVSVVNPCEGWMEVDSVSNFMVGNKVVIIQMQGAIIDESGNPDFGTITDLQSAGRYEISTIKDIIGNRIEVENYFENNYNTNGSVQIVSYPEYDNALIMSELTARFWNGTTGGVLAFNVKSELTFSAGINVSGIGFRGGITTSETNECTGAFNNGNLYFYESGNWRGAEKGEGISKRIIGKENGRGAQANGGGGGNDHNSGGGGGANLSAGGNGGERITSFFSADCRGNNPGIGGKFSAREDGRVFLGGGGGAGHSNNNVGTNGGAGGGIVLLEVGTITGQKFQIKSNGFSAINTTGGDGGGGGGAGGTVVLKINQSATLDSLIIETNGGKGGDVFNDITSTCFGPGGGGSGGFVLTDLGTINNRIASNGGGNGVSTNSTRNNCGSNNATPGSAGVIEENFIGYISGDIPIGPPVWQTAPAQTILICPDGEFMLTGEAIGLNPTYQWQIFDGTIFVDLADGANVSGSQTSTLSITMVRMMMDQSQFRLVVTDDCGNELVSNTAILTVQNGAIANFSYQENNGVFDFTNTSMNATSYFWEFGDNSTSIDFEPSHTYTMNGTYTVTLRVSGPCGVDEITQTIIVINITGPTANFDANTIEGCAPLSVQFQNQSSTNSTGFSWFFPGGMPSASTDENPTVLYQTPGTYTAILAVENSVGVDTLERINYITVNTLPVPNFNYTVTNLAVQFDDLSTGAYTYLWDFGDGNSSMMQRPLHTYVIDGIYDVTLTVENECGPASISMTITVGGKPTANFGANTQEGCAPLVVEYQNQSTSNANSFSWFFPGGDPMTSTDENPIVTYNTPGSYSAILAVENALGVDTMTKANFILVKTEPTANFSFSGTARDIQFENLSVGALTYSWDFGDNNTSNAQNPNHTYATDGVYTVILTVTNDCGEASFYNILNVGGPPTAAFENNQSNGCAPLTVIYSDISTGVITDRQWIFPGGNITTSIDESATVTYFNPGVYDVILIVENQFGKDSMVQRGLIEVQPRPFAGFQFTIDGLEVTFENTSTQATTYQWDFGDGKSSNEENPVHTFPGVGDYFVTLNSSNDFCSGSITFTVPISTNSAKELTTDGLVKIYPNPASDILKIEIDPEFLNDLKNIQLIDINGRVLDNQHGISTMNQMNVSNLPSGIYLLRFRTNDGDWVSRFIKQ